MAVTEYVPHENPAVEALAETLWIAHELAVRGDGQWAPWREYGLFQRYKFIAMAEAAVRSGYRKETSDA